MKDLSRVYQQQRRYQNLRRITNLKVSLPVFITQQKKLRLRSRVEKRYLPSFPTTKALDQIVRAFRFCREFFIWNYH
jgi:hypothetical protein